MLHVLACTTRHVRALMRQQQGRLGWVWLSVMDDEAARLDAEPAERIYRARLWNGWNRCCMLKDRPAEPMKGSCGMFC